MNKKVYVVYYDDDWEIGRPLAVYNNEEDAIAHTTEKPSLEYSELELQ